MSKNYDTPHFKLGRIAEYAIRDELLSYPGKVRELGTITKVHMVHDKLYQQMGMDLVIVSDISPVPIPVDVKDDRHLGITSNLLYEVSEIKPDGVITPGWANYSISKFIIFTNITRHKGYTVVNLPMFRERATQFIQCKQDKYTEGDDGQTMLNWTYNRIYLHGIYTDYTFGG